MTHDTYHYWRDGLQEYRIHDSERAVRDALRERGHDYYEAWQDPYEYEGEMQEGYWLRCISSEETVDGVFIYHRLAIGNLDKVPSVDLLAHIMDMSMQRLRKEARKQCSWVECYEPGFGEVQYEWGSQLFCESHLPMVQTAMEAWS